ncbi:DUF2239 family protein [Dyella nitratireducens]|uniref:DUF2239 family protein n=1 Tax=Dyella nitratireducens TaxID=1849580 RepID=A0ABQ1GH39_9GAMM|nr:DUF2239 family protein [Dyella nitratireducens]GGA43553.1 hypothetical protein GCM10010981_35880 [Dyella nitratireducens]GLQ41856.1 hypothetical protein GCM10007902_17060 [Dyella nitratireducens]
MTHAAPSASYTSFEGYRRLASGPLHVAALAIKLAAERGGTRPILIFDDSNGRSIDVDTRGSDDDVLARYQPTATDEAVTSDTAPEAPRGRGRPKLGVVAREVTLLPRHWEWLASQPGGPSVALRKLVEEGRRTHGERDKARACQERAYHFMSAIAGDMPGFEEASRALFANDPAAFAERIAAWPVDVRDHAMRLAFAR